MGTLIAWRWWKITQGSRAELQKCFLLLIMSLGRFPIRTLLQKGTHRSRLPRTTPQKAKMVSFAPVKKSGPANELFVPSVNSNLPIPVEIAGNNQSLSVTTSSKSSSSMNPNLLFSFARRAPPRSMPGPTILFFFSTSAWASLAFCSSVFSFGLPGPL